MDAGLYDLKRIRRHFRANTQTSYHHIRILPAVYGNLAGVRGAIVLASLRERATRCFARNNE